MKYDQAQRIKNLPPYLFARIEKKIAEKKAAGIDVVSLGIGDPDLPTPEHIIKRMEKESRVPANHQYPSSVGLLDFRKAVAEWYKNYYGVELNPDGEIISLIGSKEGIAYVPWCYLNQGDIALVPDPGYPVYAGGVLLAGGGPYYMPLMKENGFLPDLGAIPDDVALKAKIMFLNYPNNPTGAVANIEFFKEVVDFAKLYNIVVCHDNAYGLIAFDSYKPPSFLQVPGAADVGIEFSSLSKPYNMTGWRIGWAAGNAEVVDALARLKSNIDSGVFQAVQGAAIAGLTGEQTVVGDMCAVYRRRRDKVVDTLNDMGWALEKPKAAFYIWAPVPPGYSSESFAEMVLEKAGVVVTQGNGYGPHGEGFFRISLTIDDERLGEALERIKANVVNVEF